MQENFIKEKLENYIDNPKKFLEQIKAVMPTANLSNSIVLENNVGQKLSDLESATLINTYFTNIGSDLAKNIKALPQQTQIPTTLHIPDLDLKLSPQQPTPADILYWVKKIQIFKSSGLPQVASRIWKLLFIRIPDLLYHLVENIFTSYVFPDKWKTATVIPIPKVSKITGPEDLQPISLLSLPWKILEHLLYVQIDELNVQLFLLFLTIQQLLLNITTKTMTQSSSILTLKKLSTRLTTINY